MKNLKGLYLITDESLIKQENYFDIIASVIKVKPKLIQFRAKNLSKEESLYKAKKIRKLANKFDVKFIVNDNLDIAIQSNADGIHIGKSDEQYSTIRKAIGSNKIIGVSCYGDIERCVKFSDLGADYIAIGTPYFTKTKPERESTSFETMKKITTKIKDTPIFAIGGIDKSNLDDIIDVGVDGVAVINSVFASRNPSKSVMDLVTILNKRI